MPSITIQLNDEQANLLDKYAKIEGDEPAQLVAKLVVHGLEQAEGLEELKRRSANAPSQEEYLRILSKAGRVTS